MKIHNVTRWRTDHLRAFCARVAQDELDPPKRRRLRVEVKYNRQKDRGWTSGRAWIGGNRIVIMVPSQVVNRIDLAHTIAHEMAHARGMRHDKMRGCALYRRVGNYMERYAWAEALPLERKPKRERPALDTRRTERLNHCRVKVAEWERKAKLVRTKLRVWTRRLRAQERLLQAAAAPPPTLTREEETR